jgi:hypothetical protein
MRVSTDCRVSDIVRDAYRVSIMSTIHRILISGLEYLQGRKNTPSANSESQPAQDDEAELEVHHEGGAKHD